MTAKSLDIAFPGLGNVRLEVSPGPGLVKLSATALIGKRSMEIAPEFSRQIGLAFLNAATAAELQADAMDVRPLRNQARG